MIKLKKTTKIITLITSVIIFFALFCFIVIVGFRIITGDTSERRSLWRQRSREVISNITGGLSREQVIKIAGEHGFTVADSRIYNEPSEVRLYTPLEFGASNWVVLFGFSNNKLIYVKVRTEDNIVSKYKPKDAPEDIIYSPNANE